MIGTQRRLKQVFVLIQQAIQGLGGFTEIKFFYVCIFITEAGNISAIGGGKALAAWQFYFFIVHIKGNDNVVFFKDCQNGFVRPNFLLHFSAVHATMSGEIDE